MLVAVSSMLANQLHIPTIYTDLFVCVSSHLVQWQRIHLPMQKTQVQTLGWEDPLGEEITTPSNILAGIIPWTEEPGGLQSMGLQRVRHN